MSLKNPAEDLRPSARPPAEMTLHELVNEMLMVHRVKEPGYPERFCDLRAELEHRLDAIEPQEA